VIRAPIEAGYKVYRCLEPMRGTNSLYGHLHHPLFYTGGGVEKCEILSSVSTPLAFRGLWVKNGALICELSSDADHVQVGPSTLRSICPNGTLECDNWKNGYIALTQPHVEGLRSNLTRCYSVASRSCKIVKTH